MAKFRVDVDDGDVADAIRRRIREGVDKAADEINQGVRRTAQSKIRRENAVFRRHLLEGFETATVRFGDRKLASVTNVSDHAPYQERGVSGVDKKRNTPHEYRDKKPPIEDLIPWVRANLGGVDLDDDYVPSDDSFDDPDPDDGDGGNATTDSGGDGGSDGDDPEPPFLEKPGGYRLDDLSVGDRVVFRTGQDGQIAEITRLDPDNKVFFYEDANGDEQFADPLSIKYFADEYPFDATDWDSFQPGELVVFYSTKGGSLSLTAGVIIDAPSSNLDGSVGSFNIQTTPGATAQLVNPANIVAHRANWKPGPDFSAMDSHWVDGRLETTAQFKDHIFYNQEVIVYDTFWGKTYTGYIDSSPWDSTVFVDYDTGNTYGLDSHQSMVVAAWEDFEQLSVAEGRNRLLGYYDNELPKHNMSSAVDTETRDLLKDHILPSYDDPNKLRRVMMSWVEYREITPDPNTGKARAGVSTRQDGSWKLHMPPWGHYGTDAYWRKTFTHEEGHGFNDPDKGPQVKFLFDPGDWHRSSIWPEQNDAQYKHQFVDGLPKWEIDKSNPVHGPIQTYMFSEGLYSSFEVDSSGNILRDDRDQLDAFGWKNWRDDLRTIAEFEIATGAPPSMTTSTFNPVTDRQILHPDDPQVEVGHYLDIRTPGGFRRKVKVTDMHGEGERQTMTWQGEQVQAGFYITKDLRTGDRIEIYVDENGETIGSDLDGKDPIAVMEWANVVHNYKDEWPQLTETDKEKRLKQAANMALWYQMVAIHHDGSQDHSATKKIVLDSGYSATNTEEVTATFNQRLNNPSPDKDDLKQLEMMAQTYPRMIEAWLDLKTPRSDKIVRLLQRHGYTV